MPRRTALSARRRPAVPGRRREACDTTNMDFHFTTHAIERFRERVRPGLAWDAAEREFARVARLARATPQPPEWLADREREHAELYLVVGDLVWPMAASAAHADRRLITTRLARGGLSDFARAAQ
jgi:hypothetical protein